MGFARRRPAERRWALPAIPRPLWAALLLVLAVAGAVSLNRSLLVAPYQLQVPLADASGLYPGSDVMVAGARVGTVQEIRLEGGTALATLSLDPAYSPVHADARIALRPKSLLGEKYLALEPGSDQRTLPSGSRLAPGQVAQPVDLQDVFNSLDEPTRQKLQTLVVELGGGVGGRGAALNRGFSSGRQDLNDLATIADTLQLRDQELQEVIQNLDVVSAELARSDRRDQLGQLIQSTDSLVKTLADQDVQLKRALVETNAALSRTDTALSGTAPALNDIFRTLPGLVHTTNLLTRDLGLLMDVLRGGNNFDTFLRGVDSGPQVFGAQDAAGYATRISLIVGCGTTGAPCPTTPTLPALPLLGDGLPGIVDLLLRSPSP